MKHDRAKTDWVRIRTRAVQEGLIPPHISVITLEWQK